MQKAKTFRDIDQQQTKRHGKYKRCICAERYKALCACIHCLYMYMWIYSVNQIRWEVWKYSLSCTNGCLQSHILHIDKSQTRDQASACFSFCACVWFSQFDSKISSPERKTTNFLQKWNFILEKEGVFFKNSHPIWHQWVPILHIYCECIAEAFRHYSIALRLCVLCRPDFNVFFAFLHFDNVENVLYLYTLSVRERMLVYNCTGVCINMFMNSLRCYIINIYANSSN